MPPPPAMPSALAGTNRKTHRPRVTFGSNMTHTYDQESTIPAGGFPSTTTFIDPDLENDDPVLYRRDEVDATTTSAPSGSSTRKSPSKPSASASNRSPARSNRSPRAAASSSNSSRRILQALAAEDVTEDRLVFELTKEGNVVGTSRSTGAYSSRTASYAPDSDSDSDEFVSPTTAESNNNDDNEFDQHVAPSQLSTMADSQDSRVKLVIPNLNSLKRDSNAFEVEMELSPRREQASPRQNTSEYFDNVARQSSPLEDSSDDDLPPRKESNFSITANEFDAYVDSAPSPRRMSSTVSSLASTHDNLSRMATYESRSTLSPRKSPRAAAGLRKQPYSPSKSPARRLSVSGSSSSSSTSIPNVTPATSSKLRSEVIVDDSTASPASPIDNIDVPIDVLRSLPPRSPARNAPVPRSPAQRSSVASQVQTSRSPAPKSPRSQPPRSTSTNRVPSRSPSANNVSARLPATRSRTNSVVNSPNVAQSMSTSTSPGRVLKKKVPESPSRRSTSVPASPSRATQTDIIQSSPSRLPVRSPARRVREPSPTRSPARNMPSAEFSPGRQQQSVMKTDVGTNTPRHVTSQELTTAQSPSQPPTTPSLYRLSFQGTVPPSKAAIVSAPGSAGKERSQTRLPPRLNDIQSSPVMSPGNKNMIPNLRSPGYPLRGMSPHVARTGVDVTGDIVFDASTTLDPNNLGNWSARSHRTRPRDSLAPFFADARSSPIKLAISPGASTLDRTDFDFTNRIQRDTLADISAIQVTGNVRRDSLLSVGVASDFLDDSTILSPMSYGRRSLSTRYKGRDSIAPFFEGMRAVSTRPIKVDDDDVDGDNDDGDDGMDIVAERRLVQDGSTLGSISGSNIEEQANAAFVDESDGHMSLGNSDSQRQTRNIVDSVRSQTFVSQDSTVGEDMQFPSEIEATGRLSELSLPAVNDTLSRLIQKSGVSNRGSSDIKNRAIVLQDDSSDDDDDHSDSGTQLDALTLRNTDLNKTSHSQSIRMSISRREDDTIDQFFWSKNTMSEIDNGTRRGSTANSKTQDEQQAISNTMDNVTSTNILPPISPGSSAHKSKIPMAVASPAKSLVGAPSPKKVSVNRQIGRDNTTTSIRQTLVAVDTPDRVIEPTKSNNMPKTVQDAAIPNVTKSPSKKQPSVLDIQVKSTEISQPSAKPQKKEVEKPETVEAEHVGAGGEQPAEALATKMEKLKRRMSLSTVKMPKTAVLPRLSDIGLVASTSSQKRRASLAIVSNAGRKSNADEHGPWSASVMTPLDPPVKRPRRSSILPMPDVNVLEPISTQRSVANNVVSTDETLDINPQIYPGMMINTVDDFVRACGVNFVPEPVLITPSRKNRVESEVAKLSQSMELVDVEVLKAASSWCVQLDKLTESAVEVDKIIDDTNNVIKQLCTEIDSNPPPLFYDMSEGSEEEQREIVSMIKSTKKCTDVFARKEWYSMKTKIIDYVFYPLMQDGLQKLQHDKDEMDALSEQFAISIPDVTMLMEEKELELKITQNEINAEYTDLDAILEDLLEKRSGLLSQFMEVNSSYLELASGNQSFSDDIKKHTRRLRQMEEEIAQCNEISHELRLYNPKELGKLREKYAAMIKKVNMQVIHNDVDYLELLLDDILVVRFNIAAGAARKYLIDIFVHPSLRESLGILGYECKREQRALLDQLGLNIVDSFFMQLKDSILDDLEKDGLLKEFCAQSSSMKSKDKVNVHLSDEMFSAISRATTTVSKFWDTLFTLFQELQDAREEYPISYVAKTKSDDKAGSEGLTFGVKIPFFSRKMRSRFDLYIWFQDVSDLLLGEWKIQIASHYGEIKSDSKQQFEFEKSLARLGDGSQRLLRSLRAISSIV